jgi:hypothetical protein
MTTIGQAQLRLKCAAEPTPKENTGTKARENQEIDNSSKSKVR